MDGYTQGHVERNKKTFYFVYQKPTIFVPDTEKCPSSWLIHLRYGTKNPLKNKEKRLDYIGRGLESSGPNNRNRFSFDVFNINTAIDSAV